MRVEEEQSCPLECLQSLDLSSFFLSQEAEQEVMGEK
jgi:hypothetical protein